MFRSLLKGLADLIYPRVCLACKAHIKGAPSIDELVCMQCWAKIKKNEPPFCHCCGKHLDKKTPAKNICPRCLKRNLYFDRAFSPCVYEGTIKELIHEFKYRDKEYLGKVLGRIMCEFITSHDLPIEYVDAVVPVPLHKAKLREREFNQAEILGKEVSSRFGKAMITGALARHKATKAQADLQEQQRFINMKDSFRVIDQKAIKEKNLLLIDDVLTTGATASQAALALKNAGARIVFVLTLAN